MDYFTKDEKVVPKASTLSFLKEFARSYRATEMEKRDYKGCLLS